MARRRARGTRRQGLWQSGWVGVAFFGVFFLAGLATAYFLLLRPVWRIAESRSWTATSCSIVSSRVAENSDSDGSTYSVEVEYRYEVDGFGYQGDRYDWSVGSSSGYDGKREVVDSLPAGSTQTCYVDPKDPSRSVIQRGPGAFLWWGLFPLPFLLVGGLGLAWAALSGNTVQSKAKRPSRDIGETGQIGGSSSSVGAFVESPGRLSSVVPRQSGPRATESQAVDEVWPDPSRQAPLGELTLKPSSTRRTQVATMGCLALFWNSFVGGAYYLFFTRESAGLAPKLFLIPFALVGLCLIVATIHKALATLNPVVHLRVGAGRLELASRVRLHWQLAGKISRLRSLVIQLEGKEVARYRRGTDTVTDTHVFHESEVMRLEPLRFGQGGTEIALPGPSMPSWKANDNRIEWHLKVLGDIPRWPDINDTFKLDVQPPLGLPVALATRALDLPSPTWPDLDDDLPSLRPGALRVHLDRMRYAPGEVVTGEVTWSKSEPPDQLFVSALWHTEGKGTENSETHGQDSLESPGLSGRHPFAFHLPAEGPWSFSGTLISIVWMIEASLEPGGDLHRVYFVCAPGGEEIEL